MHPALRRLFVVSLSFGAQLASLAIPHISASRDFIAGLLLMYCVANHELMDVRHPRQMALRGNDSAYLRQTHPFHSIFLSSQIFYGHDLLKVSSISLLASSTFFQLHASRVSALQEVPPPFWNARLFSPVAIDSMVPRGFT
jgi:hypothetical protein